ncbi:hypothetical protein EON79_06160 [bacterium]|nr:MAG: hypothetical protein EON79_06160 [bacterium]
MRKRPALLWLIPPAILLAAGSVFLAKRPRIEVVGRRFSTSSYQWHDGTWVSLPETSRALDFRADGTVTMDRYVPGDGRWRLVGEELVVTFDRLDGKPAGEFKANWPKHLSTLIARAKKEQLKFGRPPLSASEVAAIKALPYPYDLPWRFKGRREWITSNGPAFILTQTAGDSIADVEYTDPDFR